MYLLGRLSPFINSGCLLPCSLGPHHSALQWFGFGETRNHHLESNPINKVGDKAIESDLGCPHPRLFEGRGISSSQADQSQPWEAPTTLHEVSPLIPVQKSACSHLSSR